MIIEVLWGGAPPGSAVAIVQTYVSRLRSAFNAAAKQKMSGEFLFGGGSSYMLEAEGHQLDLLAFDCWIERGRTATAAGKADTALDAYAEALRLWRGPPLADVDVLQSYAGTLELVRRWTDVVIDHARISIAGGAYDRALPHLRAVVARDPFHEPAYAQLLVALAGSGQSIPRSTGMRAATFRSLLAGRKVLVTADDAATTAQVLPLIPGAAGCALMVTSRRHMTFPVRETQVNLSPLSAAEAVLMLASRGHSTNWKQGSCQSGEACCPATRH